MLLLTLFTAAQLAEARPRGYQGDGAPEYCAVQAERKHESIEIPDGVARDFGAYLRVHPTGRYILYTGDKSSKLLDLSSRDATGKIVPHVIDTPLQKEAYPAEGNWRFLVSSYTSKPTSFYSTTEVVMLGELAKPVQAVDTEHPEAGKVDFNDDQHHSWYHSVAEVKAEGDTSVYRVSLYGELRFRDYTVKSDASGTPQSFTRGETTGLCGNLFTEYADRMFEISTPILSKDGSEIALNVVSQDKTDGPQRESTRVYKLDDKGNCTLQADLGFRTSKVSFSYPEKGKKGKLTFTAADTEVPGEVLSTATDRYRANVYVHDRDTGITARVNDAEPGLDVTYPGFTRDGRIMYGETRENGRKRSIGISTVVANEPAGKDAPSISANAAVKPCFQNQAEYASALKSIGGLWYEVCRKAAPPNEKSAIGRALGLNREACIKLVEKAFGAHLESPDPVIAKRVIQLKAACVPAPARGTVMAKPVKPPVTKPSPAPVMVQAPPPPRTAHEIYAQKCAQCHAPGTPYPWDLGNIDRNARAPTSTSQTLRQEIIRRINGGGGALRMPPEGSLSAQDLETFRAVAR